MKKILFIHLISFFLLELTFSFIQTAEAQIIDSVLIGHRADNTPVKAIGIKYKETIPSFTLTTNNQFLGAYFSPYKSGKWSNFGQIGMIDIATGKILWKEDMNSSLKSALCTNYGYLVTSRNGIEFIHHVSGRSIWKKQLYPTYYDKPSNLLFAYNTTSNKVRAVKINTGEILWEGHKISPHYGWPIIKFIDDSTRLIVANGIYKINIRTGEATEYDAQTGVLDARKNMTQGLLGLASATFAVISAANIGVGVYCIPTLQNTITEFHSNLLEHDSLYYFADRQGVVCLDKNLQPVWEFDLADGLCSKSHLEIKGDHLYMTNYGYAVKDNEKRVKRGLPFFATFNKHTGDLLQFNRLTSDKKIMQDAAFIGDYAFLLFEDGIAYQNPKDSLATPKPWDTKEKGKLMNIINDTLYAFHPILQTFTPLHFDGLNCPVYLHFVHNM